MKVYISGPITGMPNNNREAFEDAARRIAALGFEYVNPLELCAHLDPAVATHDDYMAVCLSAQKGCGRMVFLAGWWNSRGCRAEYRLWGRSRLTSIHYSLESFEVVHAPAKLS